MEFSKIPLLPSLGSLPAEPPPSLSSAASTATGIEGAVHNNVKTSDAMCLLEQVCPQMWAPEMATPIPSLIARPIEPALLRGDQQLPPPMAQYLVIGMVCFMAGCAITAVAVRYGLVRTCKAANDEHLALDSDNDSADGGVVTDEQLVPIGRDGAFGKAEPNGKIVAVTQQALAVKDNTDDTNNADDIAAVAAQQVPLILASNTAMTELNDVDAAAVQQAHVGNGGAVDSVANEQEGGPADGPSNSVSWKKTHRGKRAGRKVRERLNRFTTADDLLSDEEQETTNAFNSINARIGRINGWK
ncbi:hypothetical protein IW146_001591 [Coemansia sp. RSA 922]|nr:hypothetical protein GGI14_001436 [Coemansia sp. S680]KAJ2116352.1 hypothetical protein IW146_001591 [Coemansia sp. RSA 922]KAJ2430186.1 hypothetical protein GGF41_001045 [Coemansia sp. RSA 2531]